MPNTNTNTNTNANANANNDKIGLIQAIRDEIRSRDSSSE